MLYGFRPGEHLLELYQCSIAYVALTGLPIGYSVIVALTGLPIGYSVIVALTGLPIGYSVIVALTGLPIGYSVIVALTGLPIGYSVIGASLSEPHTSEKRGVIVHAQKIRQKSGNLHVLREFTGVDYSASLYGSCYRPCHDKWTA